MLLNISAHQQLRGEVSLPGDKSLSHRAALFAALAEGQSVIDNYLIAGVTTTMLSCLTQLGVRWKLENTRLTVEGVGRAGFLEPHEVLHCHHSGTTLRLLAGALVGTNTSAVLDGSTGLRSRPMKRVVEPLRQFGADIRASVKGTAPIHISALDSSSGLKGINYDMQVASAQVKSSILLAALNAAGPTTLTEPALSRDHSERLLSSMGADVKVDPSQYEVTLTPSQQPLKPLMMQLPGDFSSAAFLVAAALITPGSNVVLRNVGLNPTRIGLLEVLWDMGAEILVEFNAERHKEPVGDLEVRFSHLRGVEVQGEMVVRMIDEFPIFGLVAAYATGTTTVRGAQELRFKESDRISALCNNLKQIGVEVEEYPDGFTIQGGKALHGGDIDAGVDHRLAMTMSLFGLLTDEPIFLRGAEIIAQSFPDFGNVLSQLGAQVNWS